MSNFFYRVLTLFSGSAEVNHQQPHKISLVINKSSLPFICFEHPFVVMFLFMLHNLHYLTHRVSAAKE